MIALYHRPRTAVAAALLGDGDGLHRVESVRRRDALEGDLSCARHRARRVGGRALVPPFVESPYSVQRGPRAVGRHRLLFLAISDRTARSYVFLLASYTLPIIALPAVTNPAGVFDLAVSRTEEITLGIVCASIVGSVVFPSRLAPTIIERTDAWFRDAAFYSTETLSGRIAGAAISGARGSGSRRPSTVWNCCSASSPTITRAPDLLSARA